MEKAIEFQSDGIASPYSWAKVNANETLFSNGITSLFVVAICCRIFFPYFRNYHTVFSMTVDQTSNYLSTAISLDGTYLKINGTDLHFPLVAIPGYWNSLCFQLNFQTNTFFLQMNENVFSRTTNATKGLRFLPPTSFVFGQLHGGTGNFSSKTSFHGQLTDFNLWTRVLSVDETSSYANCELSDTGASVKWKTDNISLILNGTASLVNILKIEICRPRGTYSALLSPPLHLSVAESICNFLKGNLTIEGDAENGNSETEESSAVWNDDEEFKFREGIHSRKQLAGKWKKVSKMTRKLSSLHSVDPIEVASTFKNNLQLRKRPILADIQKPEETEKLFPVGEELSFSASCEFQKPPVFRASGYCEDLSKTLNERYVVVGRKGESPLFQGFSGGSINYARGRWIADSPFSPGIQVWFEKPWDISSASPFGRKLWLILVTVGEDVMHQDAVVPCDGENIYLNLSPCPEGLFTCSNGQCLSLSIRCDRKMDCEDGSDEDFCWKVLVPQESRPELPPPPLEEQNITEVSLKLSILKAEIDFDVMTITAEVRLTWRDPSLIFFNLQKDPLSNQVDLESLLEMWTPTVEMGNSLKSKIVVNNNSEVVILKEDFGISEDYQFSWEALGYEGSNNSIQLKEEVKIESKCIFNAFLFPFGQQVCSFPFVLLSSTPEAITLTTDGFHGGVHWERAEEDLMYEISSVNFKIAEEKIYSSQELIFKLFPRLGLPLIALFLPSLFTVIIAYSTFHMSLTYHQMRIGISLVALLVLSIIQAQWGFSYSSRTGIKASDVWFLGVFIIIFLILTSQMMLTKDRIVEGEKLCRSSRILPLNKISMKANDGRMDSAATAGIASEWSQKMKTIFSILIPVLIIMYIIIYTTLVAIHTI